jgi:hypothetical protein
MAEILIISFTNLYKDPRVYRQISFLKEKNSITEIGLKSSQHSDIEFIQAKLNYFNYALKVKGLSYLKVGLFEKYYWESLNYKEIIKSLSNKEFDVIIANDIESVPLAIKIKKNARIIFDAHEYSPKQFDDQILFRHFYKKYIEYLFENYLMYVDKMITVSEGIAEEYYKNYKIKPVVISNASDFVDIEPSPVAENNIKIIYHGGSNSSRHLETMIHMMDYVDKRYHLDLMLVHDANFVYFNKLKTLVKSRNNVRIIEPTSMQNIVNYTKDYDIGLYILKPTNFNQKHSLPNKLFEYIQARLAIAIGPSIEMAKIVEKHNLGIVAENFEPITLAEKLNNLTQKDIEYYKNQSHLAAYELSSSKNLQILETTIQEILNKNKIKSPVVVH